MIFIIILTHRIQVPPAKLFTSTLRTVHPECVYVSYFLWTFKFTFKVNQQPWTLTNAKFDGVIFFSTFFKFDFAIFKQFWSTIDHFIPWKVLREFSTSIVFFESFFASSFDVSNFFFFFFSILAVSFFFRAFDPQCRSSGCWTIVDWEWTARSTFEVSKIKMFTCWENIGQGNCVLRQIGQGIIFYFY